MPREAALSQCSPADRDTRTSTPPDSPRGSDIVSSCPDDDHDGDDNDDDCTSDTRYTPTEDSKSPQQDLVACLALDKSIHDPACHSSPQKLSEQHSTPAAMEERGSSQAYASCEESKSPLSSGATGSSPLIRSLSALHIRSPAPSLSPAASPPEIAERQENYTQNGDDPRAVHGALMEPSTVQGEEF
ncbi:hypothetical protein C8Q80DRAFT_819216 [Daedaleopsis nitida]|nr:hypothetical protein C8Q80DRAFT_819216 [Daedaleopsis nitida]